jgi:hypothetical protein
MSNWFKKMFGGASDGASAGTTLSLDQQLLAYPPNTLPYFGDPKKLTVARQEANLAHFMATLEMRLEHVSSLLDKNGIGIGAMLDAIRSEHEAMAVADGIDKWLASQEEALRRLLPNADGTQCFEQYRQSSRAGDEIIFTLAADLALLEGEAVRRRHPDFSWQICNEKHLARTFHSKAICLIRPAKPGETLPYVLEFEYMMVDLLYDRISGRPPLRHYGKHLGQQFLDSRLHSRG